jgi:hypothetical protein
MKHVLNFLITLYQITLSPVFTVVFGTRCRYEVSCSEYTKHSINKYGVLKGLKLGLVRLLSCQPFGKIHIT